MVTTGGATLCALTGTWGGSGCSGDCASSAPVAPEGSYSREQDRLLLWLSEIDDLKPVGGAVVLFVNGSEESADEGPGFEILVAHVEESEYRAYPNRCTHNDKELDFLPEEGILRCCSEHSTFELSGDVIEGKATRALRLYDVQLEDERLVILLES